MSTGTLQQRLFNAAIYNLIHIKPENLPAGKRDEFKKLVAALTRVPQKGNEGSIQATTSRLSDDEAKGHAHTILNLYEATLEARGERRKKA
ncbi:MAG: hypothetical protein NTY77_05760 [Elusimicrobia bacterium]|nr:hypothetical protein [Elusimicrobiota bacterium]